MRPWEVGRLTPWQAWNLYLCERDDAGNIELPEEFKPQPLGREELLRLYGQAIKLRPWEVDRLVAERMNPQRR